MSSGGCLVDSACRECGGCDVVTDFGAGDVVCRDCGMILGERIVDDTPEWRTFANDDRGGDAMMKSRVGDAGDARLDQVSLASILVDSQQMKRKRALDDGSGSGNSMTPNHKRPSLRHAEETAQQRRMKTCMEKIQQVAERLTLPKQIVEVALDLYVRAEKHDDISVRGKEKDQIVVAVLFLACRQTGNSRTLKEFEDASGIDKKQIGKSFLLLSKRLHLEVQFASTEEYVQRFCSRLGLPSKTQAIANDVAKKTTSMGLLTGKSPIAIAASVIYLVSAYTNAKRTIEEISHVTMLNEKKVKVVCKELNKSRVDLFAGVVLS